MAKKIDIPAEPHVKGASYPPPFDAPCAGRRRWRLGDLAGLSHFGINLLRLAPGAWSSQRHWHSAEDEFVYVLEGEAVLVTDDEEGVAEDGTRRVVEALQIDHERIDHCVVGEPSSTEALGDMIKVGRRGSLNAVITSQGRQGHVAYPHRALNPLPPLIALLARLQAHVLDDGYPQFQPSNLEVTTIDVGNPTTNVIPARAAARLNIRFNPAHTAKSLTAWLEAERVAAQAGFEGRLGLEVKVSGEAFLTEPGPFVDVVAEACRDVAGRTPQLSTTGGTSDARFIRALCPVVELGLVGQSMHAVDEHAAVADIRTLTAVYRRLIALYFERF